MLRQSGRLEPRWPPPTRRCRPGATRSLPMMLRTWTSAVFSVIPRARAICRLVFPAATMAATWRSREVSPTADAAGGFRRWAGWDTRTWQARRPPRPAWSARCGELSRRLGADRLRHRGLELVQSAAFIAGAVAASAWRSIPRRRGAAQPHRRTHGGRPPRANASRHYATPRWSSTVTYVVSASPSSIAASSTFPREATRAQAPPRPGLRPGIVDLPRPSQTLAQQPFGLGQVTTLRGEHAEVLLRPHHALVVSELGEDASSFAIELPPRRTVLGRVRRGRGTDSRSRWCAGLQRAQRACVPG